MLVSTEMSSNVLTASVVATEVVQMCYLVMNSTFSSVDAWQQS